MTRRAVFQIAAGVAAAAVNAEAAGVIRPNNGETVLDGIHVLVWQAQFPYRGQDGKDSYPAYVHVRSEHPDVLVFGVRLDYEMEWAGQIRSLGWTQYVAAPFGMMSFHPSWAVTFWYFGKLVVLKHLTITEYCGLRETDFIIQQ
jgi:hypothetical protein